MKRLTRTLPLILAAALQLLPLLRNIVTSPAAGSSFAFILRWGIGSAAALGAYDAFSAASGIVMTSPTNIVGTVGVQMNTNVNIIIGGGNTAVPADGFLLTTINQSVTSPLITNGQSTAVCLPAGLTFRCVSINNATNIYGVLSGTPTIAGKTNINVEAYYASKAQIFPTNIWITILAATPPVITNQPVSLTNSVGSNVSFSTTAGGAAPLSYQWYFNTNSALLNQTNTSLTLTNVQLTNAGFYSVTITNAAGSTNSAFALLTVWQPPIITNHPVSLTNVAGSTVTFGVVAGGAPALAYQWKFNTSTVLTNATGTSLSLTNLRASQAGTYSVTITNAGGVTNSLFATLVVTNPLPPAMNGLVNNSGAFRFTFTPVVGLTNTVLTNSLLNSTNWGVFTNLPPPATASPITLTNLSGNANLFYRLMIQP